MIFFLKGAMALAATITSLLGVWQAVQVLELQPYLTLPAYENVKSYLALVGYGSADSSFGLIEKENATHTFDHDTPVQEPIVVEVKFPTASTKIQSWIPAAISTVFSAPTASRSELSQHNVEPSSDENGPSPGQLVLEKLSSFATIVESLFSFVEEWPTTPREALQFSLVAVFIVGIVFVTGSVSYWSLRFIDLRGQRALVITTMLPNGTEVAFTGSPGEENNALVSVTEMVRSLPKRTLPANIDHALAHNQVMEVLAFMTEIAQAHCDSMKNNLCSTFRKIVQDTVSPNIGDEDQVAKMKEELDESIKSKLDSCNAKLDSTLKSKFDSCYSKIETMLNSKADRHLVTKLENKLNSKVDGSLLSKLDIKVDEIATDVKTTAQLEGKFNAAIKESDNVSAQALAKIKTSLSDHNLTASDVLTKLEGLKSSFKDLDKISTKQRSENGHLVQQLREKEQARLAQEKAQLAVEKACKIQEKALQAQQQAHEAQISKMTCTANERYTETMAQFTQLENTLLHKVDVSQTQQNVRLAVEKAREIQENALQDQEEAHVAQISKMTAIANERYTELIAKVAKLENTLLHKAELSNCESLKGKVTNVEDNLKSEVKQLQADLKKTKAKIDPKTHHIGPRLDKQQKDLDLLQNEVQTQVANVTAKFVEHQEELVRMRSLLSAKSTQTPIQPAPTPSNGVARPTKGTTKGPTNTPVPSKSSTGSTSQPSNGRPPFLSDIKGTTSQHPSAAEKGAAQMMASRHARPPAPTAPPAPPAPTAPTAPSAPSAPSGLPAKPPKALDSSRWAQDPSFSPPSTTVEQRMQMAMNPNGPASVALEHHTPSQLTNSIHATPKDKKFPPGEGPGPNGGQRVNTPRTKGHNRERGIKNNVKKALLQFTEAQQQHARCCQDPVNLTFARDSPWAWLNPIVKEGKRFHEVRPPYGWSVPN